MVTITPASYIYKLVCYEGIPKFTSFLTTSTASITSYLIPVMLFYIYFLAFKALGKADKSKDAFTQFERSLANVVQLRKMIKEGRE